jgi:hypothetical protein
MPHPVTFEIDRRGSVQQVADETDWLRLGWARLDARLAGAIDNGVDLNAQLVGRYLYLFEIV